MPQVYRCIILGTTKNRGSIMPNSPKDKGKNRDRGFFTGPEPNPIDDLTDEVKQLRISLETKLGAIHEVLEQIKKNLERRI